jgi:hypothetical protein
MDNSIIIYKYFKLFTITKQFTCFIKHCIIIEYQGGVLCDNYHEKR